jgi:hypothetical protein
MFIIYKDIFLFDIDMNPKFQDVWAVKMPWAKSNFNDFCQMSRLFQN